MKNTNVQETMRANHTITEEALKSIKTKHNEKITEPVQKIKKFTEKKKSLRNPCVTCRLLTHL